MGLIGWLTRSRGSEQDRRLRQWREAWEAATRAEDASAASRLRSELDALALPEEEIEIEREMLDALEELGTLSSAVESAGLPTIQTGHRVVGTDACHFTAPASMPDELSQPGGRLLLTSARLIFVCGPGATAAWHTLADVIQSDRDVVLIRADRARMYRFRCNSYTDALTAAFFARRLISARRATDSHGCVHDPC